MVKANEKRCSVAINLLVCPICLEITSAPIFLCQSGHSLCNSCTTKIQSPLCPICRQNLTQIRNWQLEEIVEKAKVPCPNKSSGCVYTVMAGKLEKHLKKCIFREMDCPLGVVSGKCSWTGYQGQGQAKNKNDEDDGKSDNKPNPGSDPGLKSPGPKGPKNAEGQNKAHSSFQQTV